MVHLRYLALLVFVASLVASTVWFTIYGSTCDYTNSGKFAQVISNKRGKTQRLTRLARGWGEHENIAFRKFATLSSLFGNWGVNGAFHATDGDTKDAIIHTNEEEQPYLDVDLGRKYIIRTVRVWNRNADPDVKERLVPFKVLIGNVPFGTTLLEATHNSLAAYGFSDTQDIYVWNIPHGVEARFVRVQLERRSFLHITELEVFESVVGSDYVAQHATYVREHVESPMISLPDNYYSFLRLAAAALDLDNAARIFTEDGKEITASKYNGDILSESGRKRVYYISEGENFIGDVRVCVVFLCTEGRGYNTDSDYTAEVRNNLQILTENVFLQYLYDVIIFYSWGTRAEETKEMLRNKFPYFNFKFVDVSRHFPPTLPQHLIDNKVDMSLFEKGTDCAPGNHWSLNYLSMGRFWSVGLWSEPVLGDYDLVWRLDADATVDAPMMQNFLRDMWAKNKTLGYLCRTSDPPECASGLEAAATEFGAQRNIKFKHKNLVEERTIYWGGFGVYATKFFCKNQDWLDYVKYLDSLGGFYNHRWGEQNVFPVSLSLFLQFSELYWVRDEQVAIYHDHVKHRSCSGVNMLREMALTGAHKE